MTLLTSQKNTIYKTIERAAFDPREFRWENRDAEPLGFEGSEAETLVHVPTGFACMMLNASIPARDRLHSVYDRTGDYLLCFEPGTESRVESFTGISLDSALLHIDQWLANIKRETTEPDLWAQLASEGGAFGNAITGLETANTAFTLDERRRIAQGLDEIKAALAAQYQLSEQQAATIDRAFEALKTASERVGRKDWVLLLGGTLMGIIGNTVFPAETVKGLFHIVGQVFQWLLQQGHLLPPFP